MNISVPLLSLAVQGGVRWLKGNAENLTGARDIAITISALVAAEKNPHSHLVQRLVSYLVRLQAENGSWSDELWDTTWATKALYDAGSNEGNDHLAAAYRFIEQTRDPRSGTWYEEPFETMLVLDLLARTDPTLMRALAEPGLKWLKSLQAPQGCIVGIRYTGMAASLYRLAEDIGIPVDSTLIKDALEFIRNEIRDQPIWTSAAWSNYYPLKALLDCGATIEDEAISKAVQWFIASQDADGKWMQVSKVHDTAMAVLSLAGLLSAPLVDISSPRTGVLSFFKENGTIRVSFHEPGTGAITPAERLKISDQVRDDLSRNQQLVVSTMRRPRAARPIVPHHVNYEPDIDTELARNGRYAYGHLIPPRIQAALQNSTADHLRLEIDERLIDLPWELIHDGGDFLCIRYGLGRLLMSDQEFLPARRRPRSAHDSRVLVVADPTSDLPAAKLEGRRVASLLRDRCNMHVDEYTTIGMTKKDFLLSLRTYDLIHFAGHASHDPSSPDESCLVFADGEIPAFEIARFIATRSPAMVFLNACWSAEELRDPDLYTPMMRGLGRTFLYAGVAAFIGYLVPVPDESATQFAIRVYEGVVQGQSIGESLRRARIQCRNKNDPSDLTWCSAVLYGDPSAKVVEVNLTTRDR